LVDTSGKVVVSRDRWPHEVLSRPADLCDRDHSLRNVLVALALMADLVALLGRPELGAEEPGLPGELFDVVAGPLISCVATRFDIDFASQQRPASALRVSVRSMECSCCSRDLGALVTLRDREDVRVCRDCLEWMLGQVGIMSTPTLPVVVFRKISSTGQAGFGVRIYKKTRRSGRGLAFVDFDGQSAFTTWMSSTSTGAKRRRLLLIVPDVDGWHPHDRRRVAGITGWRHAVGWNYPRPVW
jgi:hypothetical protein